MPVVTATLGEALLRVYDFPFCATLYLSGEPPYDALTPCAVAWAEGADAAEEAALHGACLGRGFGRWLNVAVVSDTVDEAAGRTEAGLVAAFNEELREGRWLWRMLDWRGAGA